MANMVTKSFLIRALVHVYDNIGVTRTWDLVCKNTPKPHLNIAGVHELM